MFVEQTAPVNLYKGQPILYAFCDSKSTKAHSFGNSSDAIKLIRKTRTI